MPESRLRPELRRLVNERARGCCEYCRAQQAFDPDPFVVEHVIPRVRGGATSGENLARSCQGCNGHKYVRTDYEDPVSGVSVALFNPRRQNWLEHFGWSDDFTRVEGLTPTGRATVLALRLNRPGLVKLRQVLHLVGQQPPPTSTPGA